MWVVACYKKPLPTCNSETRETASVILGFPALHFLGVAEKKGPICTRQYLLNSSLDWSKPGSRSLSTSETRGGYLSANQNATVTANSEIDTAARHVEKAVLWESSESREGAEWSRQLRPCEKRGLWVRITNPLRARRWGRPSSLDVTGRYARKTTKGFEQSSPARSRVGITHARWSIPAPTEEGNSLKSFIPHGLETREETT